MGGDCRVIAVCRMHCPKSEKRRGKTKRLKNVEWSWLPSLKSRVRTRGSFTEDQIKRHKVVASISALYKSSLSPPPTSRPTYDHITYHITHTINQINHNVQKNRLHRPRSGQQSHGCRRQTFNRSLIPRRRSRSQQRKKKLPRERYVHPHSIAVTFSMAKSRPSMHWQPWI